MASSSNQHSASESAAASHASSSQHSSPITDKFSDSNDNHRHWNQGKLKFSSCKISVKIVLTSFFVVVFLVAWFIPVYLISSQTLLIVDSSVRRLGDEVSRSTISKLQREVMRGRSSVESFANWTYRFGVPTANDSLYDYRAGNSSISAALLSPKARRSQYLTKLEQSAAASFDSTWANQFQRFSDGSASFTFGADPRKIHFAQLCKSRNAHTVNYSLPLAVLATQYDDLFDCDILLLNFTSGTSIDPATNHPAFNVRFAFLYRTFWTGDVFRAARFTSMMRQARKNLSSLDEVGFVDVSPLFVGRKALGIEPSILFMIARVTSFQGIPASLHDQRPVALTMTGFVALFMQSLLRSALPPGTDEKGRSFVVSSGADPFVAVWSHGSAFQVVNTTIPATGAGNFALVAPKNCYKDADAKSMGCLYNLSTHPQYRLLRLFHARLAGEKVADIYRQSFLLVRDDDDGDGEDEEEYVALRRPLFSTAEEESSLQNLDLLIPVNQYKESFRKLTREIYIIIAFLVVFGACATFFILHMVTKRISLLADALSEDPFSRAVEEMLKSSFAYMTAKKTNKNNKTVTSASNSEQNCSSDNVNGTGTQSNFSTSQNNSTSFGNSKNDDDDGNDDDDNYDNNNTNNDEDGNSNRKRDDENRNARELILDFGGSPVGEGALTSTVLPPPKPTKSTNVRRSSGDCRTNKIKSSSHQLDDDAVDGDESEQACAADMALETAIGAAGSENHRLQSKAVETRSKTDTKKKTKKQPKSRLPSSSSSSVTASARHLFGFFFAEIFDLEAAFFEFRIVINNLRSFMPDGMVGHNAENDSSKNTNINNNNNNNNNNKTQSPIESAPITNVDAANSATNTTGFESQNKKNGISDEENTSTATRLNFKSDNSNNDMTATAPSPTTFMGSELRSILLQSAESNSRTETKAGDVAGVDELLFSDDDDIDEDDEQNEGSDLDETEDWSGLQKESGESRRRKKKIRENGSPSSSCDAALAAGACRAGVVASKVQQQDSDVNNNVIKTSNNNSKNIRKASLEKRRVKFSLSGIAPNEGIDVVAGGGVPIEDGGGDAAATREQNDEQPNQQRPRSASPVPKSVGDDGDNGDEKNDKKSAISPATAALRKSASPVVASGKRRPGKPKRLAPLNDGDDDDEQQQNRNNDDHQNNNNNNNNNNNKYNNIAQCDSDSKKKGNKRSSSSTRQRDESPSASPAEMRLLSSAEYETHRCLVAFVSFVGTEQMWMRNLRQQQNGRPHFTDSNNNCNNRNSKNNGTYVVSNAARHQVNHLANSGAQPNAFSTNSLLKRSAFIAKTMIKTVIQSTGAHLIEYRGDQFIIVLRLSRRPQSRLAFRFVSKLIQAGNAVAKYHIGRGLGRCEDHLLSCHHNHHLHQDDDDDDDERESGHDEEFFYNDNDFRGQQQQKAKEKMDESKTFSPSPETPRHQRNEDTDPVTEKTKNSLVERESADDDHFAATTAAEAAATLSTPTEGDTEPKKHATANFNKTCQLKNDHFFASYLVAGLAIGDLRFLSMLPTDRIQDDAGGGCGVDDAGDGGGAFDRRTPHEVGTVTCGQQQQLQPVGSGGVVPPPPPLPPPPFVPPCELRRSSSLAGPKSPFTASQQQQVQLVTARPISVLGSAFAEASAVEKELRRTIYNSSVMVEPVEMMDGGVDEVVAAAAAASSSNRLRGSGGTKRLNDKNSSRVPTSKQLDKLFSLGVYDESLGILPSSAAAGSRTFRVEEEGDCNEGATTSDVNPEKEKESDVVGVVKTERRGGGVAVAVDADAVDNDNGTQGISRAERKIVEQLKVTARSHSIGYCIVTCHEILRICSRMRKDIRLPKFLSHVPPPGRNSAFPVQVAEILAARPIGLLKSKVSYGAAAAAAAATVTLEGRNNQKAGAGPKGHLLQQEVVIVHPPHPQAPVEKNTDDKDFACWLEQKNEQWSAFFTQQYHAYQQQQQQQQQHKFRKNVIP